jgi:hypothetical protein
MTEAAADLYLDLLKRSLLNLIYEDLSFPQSLDDGGSNGRDGMLARMSGAVLFAASSRGPFKGLSGYTQHLMPRTLRTLSQFDRSKRLEGRDFPSQAHTMIGMKRLDNIHALLDDVLENDVPGDLIETGVWRGGSTIFMRGLLKARGVTDRRVWVADSFVGMPQPDQEGMEHSFSSSEQAETWRNMIRRHPMGVMVMAAHLRQGTSYDEVRQHFARYGLLDDQVEFLRGWFRETLPSAPISNLALLRLDGDLYDSTHDALTWLYPKLSVGGYTIVDDYGSFSECRRAVHDYLDGHKLEADLQRVDEHAVFWQKPAARG